MPQQAQAIINQKKQQKTIQSVQYPADLSGYYMSFDFYEYRTFFGDNSSPTSNNNPMDAIRQVYNADKQSVQNQIAKPSSFAKVKLPIPNNLVDSFKVNYENKQFGGVAGVLSEIVTSAKGIDWSGDKTGQLGNIPVNMPTAVIQAATAAASKDLFFGADTGGLFSLATGTAINPNLTVLFRGPTLKTHQFQWRLAPRSQEESLQIKKIEAIVKRAMHPRQISQTASAVLHYPCECLAQFISPNSSDNSIFLYPLRPVVVESFQINYGPNGIPSFFDGSDEPTSIEINMHLQETSYYTRDSFDNVNEYGYDGFNTTQLTSGGEDAFNSAPYANTANSDNGLGGYSNTFDPNNPIINT